MAMSDYFYKCNILESRVVSDRLGGFETVEYVGIEIMGLAVKGGITEQAVGALRGSEEAQYTFHTYSSVPLKKDDKIMFTEAGVTKYIRLTSNETINTERSAQTEWKSYSAESYVPTRIVTGS